MTTQLSTKLAALGAALMVNSAMIGGIAFLFNGPLPRDLPLASPAEASFTAPGVAPAPRTATV